MDHLRKRQSTFRWSATRLGSRRTIMLLISIMGICNGLILLGNPYPEEGWLLYYYLPIPVRFWLWLGTSAIALVIAIFGPRRLEWLGWYSLLLMPIQRLVGHAVAFVVYLLPGGYYGSWLSGVYGLFWSAAVLMLWRLSQWIEDTLIPTEDDSVGTAGSMGLPGEDQ